MQGAAFEQRYLGFVPAMRATLPDGRALSWEDRWPYLSGDQALAAEVRMWLAARNLVCLIPATLADHVAAFIAMRAVAPSAQWEGNLPVTASSAVLVWSL